MEQKLKHGPLGGPNGEWFC